MTVYTFTGRLTDYGGAPFPNAVPELWVEPERPGYSATGIMADKRIPVTVASDGSFSVQLEASSTVSPEAIYLLRCEWHDPGGPRTWAEWARFRAPVGGGNIGDLNTAPQPSWSIAYGYGPPPAGVTGLYIDVSGATAQLYAPEGGRV